MIIIFGRRELPPRVIEGVTHFHARGPIFGWFRGKNKFGFGVTKEWMRARYTHVFVIDGYEVHHITGG